MIIEAQEHRLYWKILAVGYVVDLIGAACLAVILQWWLAPDDHSGFLLGVGLLWLTLQFFRFVIMLLNVARLWAANELGAFKASREAFVTALRQSELPKPAYTHSVDSYLSNIADDEIRLRRRE